MMEGRARDIATISKARYGLGTPGGTSCAISLLDLFPSAPNFEKTLMVAIKQGGTAKVAISLIVRTIKSIINYSLFFVARRLL